MAYLFWMLAGCGLGIGLMALVAVLIWWNDKRKMPKCPLPTELR